MVERRTREREFWGSKSISVFEQDTLPPESTGNTQEVEAPSRHD